MYQFETIYENGELLAIYKPAEISFHTENGAPGIAAQVNSSKQAQLWPVHRLDKMTSGLLLFAKSKKHAATLNHLFSDRKIQKTYIALSDRKPSKKQGAITGDMQKSRNGSWMLKKDKQNPAITNFNTCSLVPGKRFFWIQPITGKTHQIRVALKSLGSPILGDTRYQGTNADRGYLHAYQLCFVWNTEKIQINCAPREGEWFNIKELAHCINRFNVTPDSLEILS